ncbi:uncharacterized protein EI97DRAFT_130415 [Westerdykella ornata]|uniref:Uncharacterized protein n=1 Tax=Westerdykella ornata TaxID=318751 RepID=A0A6A6JDW2_WESOR|nr:uncharacterized protein EI97DRAFT_130415 [Westerdykella ornata]KAF2274188.1 hypothetical protein EI97DRAFT_130415 [Westerdykella ornata]
MMTGCCKNTSADLKILWKTMVLIRILRILIVRSNGRTPKGHSVFDHRRSAGTHPTPSDLTIGPSAAEPSEPTHWLFPIWKPDVNSFADYGIFSDEVHVSIALCPIAFGYQNNFETSPGPILVSRVNNTQHYIHEVSLTSLPDHYTIQYRQPQKIPSNFANPVAMALSNPTPTFLPNLTYLFSATVNLGKSLGPIPMVEGGARRGSNHRRHHLRSRVQRYDRGRCGCTNSSEQRRRNEDPYTVHLRLWHRRRVRFDGI